MKWNHCHPSLSWSIVDNDSVIEPLADQPITLLSEGEQIVFCRHFDGLAANPTYFEINQKLSHLLNVHFVAEKKSWCTLCENGDLEEVFKVIEIDPSQNDNNTIVLAKRKFLDTYMCFNNLILLRMWDFTRFDLSSFPGWNQDQDESYIAHDNTIFGNLKDQEICSMFRGIQLIHYDPKVRKEDLANHYWGPDDENTEYCSYIAHDFKNKKIALISCDRSKLSNYVEKSELPYEMTPAFFRPEVLLKYKSDTDKYTLSERSVYCRGGMELKKV